MDDEKKTKEEKSKIDKEVIVVGIILLVIAISIIGCANKDHSSSSYSGNDGNSWSEKDWDRAEKAVRDANDRYYS